MIQDKIKSKVPFSHFGALDIRVGRILEAKNFPEAKSPAYKLLIDFGSLGQKKSSAQITHTYSPDQLIGKMVVAVVNFPDKQIANTISECLVLGAVDDDKNVFLLQPDKGASEGWKIG